MPDHRGSLFQHKHSKLIQLKTYDINFNLIPTYRLSQTLKPGTVIMANCTLHCYITTGQFKSRKVSYISHYLLHTLLKFLFTDISTKCRHDSYPR